MPERESARKMQKTYVYDAEIYMGVPGYDPRHTHC